MLLFLWQSMTRKVLPKDALKMPQFYCRKKLMKIMAEASPFHLTAPAGGKEGKKAKAFIFMFFSAEY